MLRSRWCEPRYLAGCILKKKQRLGQEVLMGCDTFSISSSTSLEPKNAKHQQGKTRQGEAHRSFAAPAELIMAPQQDREQQPGNDGQHGFVHQVLGKNIVDEDKAGGDGDR